MLHPTPETIPLGLDLRHLRYFLAVAEELHFGRAAQRLHLAQPALSQAIRKLEEGLEVKLLERTSRSVTLTRAGSVLAKESRRILVEVELAVAETRRAAGVGSVLRVGYSHHAPMRRLQVFLRALQEWDPKIVVEVRHMFSLEQVACLESWELDLGILYHPAKLEHIEMEPLFQGESLSAVLPHDHRLASRTCVSPDDVQGENLIIFPRHVNPWLYDRMLGDLGRAGFSFRTVFEAVGPSRGDQLLAVAARRGICVVPFGLTQDEAEAVVCRPLDPPVTMPSMMIAWRDDPRPQLARVLDGVRHVARQLYGAYSECTLAGRST